MTRQWLARLLIAAFVGLSLSPARASWACPDGTPCVLNAVREFECAEHSAVPKSCCEVVPVVRCRHGSLPGIVQAPNSTAKIHGPDHCRFSVSAVPQPTASVQGRGLDWSASDLLTAPAQAVVTAPAGKPLLTPESGLGYRPPPILLSGPARAPPAP